MSILGRLFHRDGMEDYRRGIIYFNNKEYDRAIEAFERTLQAITDPSDPYYNLGRFYAAEAHAKLGLALYHQLELERAAEEFRKAIGCGYRYPDLHVHLATILDRQEDDQGAEEQCRAALAIHPGYQDARCRLVLSLARQRREEEAASELASLAREGFPVGDWSPEEPSRIDATVIKHLRATLESRQRSAGLVRSALQSYDEGDPERAIGELREALREQPRYADLRCKLGTLLLETGSVKEALEQLNEALAINPDYVEARLQAGIALLRSHDPAGAIAHLRFAADHQPDYPDLHLFLGLAYLRDGRIEEAGDHLVETLEKIPNFHKARYVLGLVRLVQGRTEEAEESLRAVVEQDPMLARARTTLGFLRLQRGDASEAATLFRQVLDIDPGEAAASLGLGLSHGALMQPEPAREHLRRAIEAERPPLAALEALAELELLEKHPKEAIQLLDRGLSVYAGHRRLLTLRGRAWAEAGVHDRAREDYEAALATDTTRQETQIALGLSLLRLGKREAARDAMGAAFLIDPTDPVACAFADDALIESL